MKETKLYCDICKKELPFNFVVIKISIGDSRTPRKDTAWQYQDYDELDVCDNCVGGEINRCNGSHGRFGVENRLIPLLKKFKLIKTN